MTHRKNYRAILTCLAVVTLATPTNAIDIYLSNTTATGSAVTQNETEAFDISVGGTKSLAIWIKDISTILTGVDLNLLIHNDVGNAIDFTGATVNNPTVGATKRWFDDGNIIGVGVDLVSGDEIHLIGSTTDTGLPGIGEGTGLGVAADPDDDGADAAFLFATVDYTIVDVGGSADFFLQIGDEGISDTNGLVTSVVFGLVDPALDASVLGERNLNSATREGIAGSPFSADFDNDFDVDGDDLTQWEGNYGVNGSSDANGDGDSSGEDFLIWQQQFGSGVPSQTSAVTQVPEPASAVLLIASVIVGVFTRIGNGVKQCERPAAPMVC